jgi:hypothetical protein
MKRLNKVIEMKFGSHVYGTNTPSSDTDIKGIFIPSIKDILLCKAPKNIQHTTKEDSSAKNTVLDTDTEYFALHNFIEQLLAGQTFALDMLFTPIEHWMSSDANDTWYNIVENKNQFLHKNIKPFFGYARQQAAKYGVKGSRVNAVKSMLDRVRSLDMDKKIAAYEPTLRELAGIINSESADQMNNRPLVTFIQSAHIKDKGLMYLEICDRQIPFTNKIKDLVSVLTRLDDNYGNRARQAASNSGIDWKALSHAVRVGQEAIELLQTGNITFPRLNADLLLKIKTGQFVYTEVAEMIEKTFEDLILAEKTSQLPAEPNREFADGLILDIYGQAVLDYLT